MEPSLLLCCGNDKFSDVWFASSHEYCAMDSDFEIRISRHAGQHHNIFVACQNLKLLGIPPQCCGEVFVAVLFK